MYLGTGDIIAIIIALGTALTVLGLAVRDNARLQKENKRLRMRVRELNKQVETHA
jgi:regulator of replication initiation timing